MGLLYDIESPFKCTANICGKHLIEIYVLPEVTDLQVVVQAPWAYFAYLLMEWELIVIAYEK